MEYFFSIESTLDNVDIEHAKQLFTTINFHENICKKIPGTSLDIQRSDVIGHQYFLDRAYNLNLDMPDLVRKLLKDAFRLQRKDQWDFTTLSATSTLQSNLPGILYYQTFLREQNNIVQILQEWKLDIGIPLIHKALAKFAEAEIRKYFAIEMQIIKDEIQADLKQ